MKSVAVSGVVLVCSVSFAMEEEDAGRLVFETSAPELVPQPDVAQGLLSPELYTDLAEKMRGSEDMVAIHQLPDTDLPLVGYGINFSFGGLNRGFAVFGSPQTGYRLYADVDADGGLADEAPWQLEQESEGRYSVAFETADTGQAGGKPVEFPITSRFVIYPGDGSDDASPRGAWNADTVRRGEARIAGTTVPFEVFGYAGRYYDEPHQSVWFDLDADGTGRESPESPERFRNLDEYVNIGERSYAFHVDPFGRHLTLVPEDEARPDRPVLAEGEPAPGFQATSVEGRAIELSDYRGKLLLLDFWAVWCGPCRDDAPRLAELNRRWQENGLQTIGVTTDSADTIEGFTSEFEHDWPQVSEPFEGPVHRAYRVNAYPTKYLIDRNGDLLCGSPGPTFWEECWPKAEARLRSRAD